MNEFFAYIGVIVVLLAVIAVGIPLLVGTVQFWTGMVTDMKRWRQRRRDKNSAVQ